MGNCAVCEKKIGIFQITYPINEQRSDILICEKCDRYIRNLLDEESMATEETYNYFSSKKYSDEYVREYISKLVSCKKGSDAEIQMEIEAEVEAANKVKQEIQRMQDTISTCMCTTGYNFEGYVIVKYYSLVSGESALGTGFISELSSSLNDFLGTSSSKYESKLSLAKKQAVNKMISYAVQEGANAIIGIDYDILTLANNMILVSANGTAVKVEKKE